MITKINTKYGNLIESIRDELDGTESVLDKEEKTNIELNVNNMSKNKTHKDCYLDPTSPPSVEQCFNCTSWGCGVGTNELLTG